MVWTPEGSGTLVLFRAREQMHDQRSVVVAGWQEDRVRQQYGDQIVYETTFVHLGKRNNGKHRFSCNDSHGSEP